MLTIVCVEFGVRGAWRFGCSVDDVGVELEKNVEGVSLKMRCGALKLIRLPPRRSPKVWRHREEGSPPQSTATGAAADVLPRILSFPQVSAQFPNGGSRCIN
jgi:hypothetical protein